MSKNESIKVFLDYVNYVPSINHGGVFSALSCTLKGLYDKYVTFCVYNGFIRESMRNFNLHLSESGFTRIKNSIIVYVDCDTTMNSIDRFLKSRGYSPFEEDGFLLKPIEVGSLYNDYSTWCVLANIDANSLGSFQDALIKRSYNLSSGRLPFSGETWDVYVNK